VFSIFFGWLFDFIINPGQPMAMHYHSDDGWFAILSAVILLALFVFIIIHDLKAKFRLKYAGSMEIAMGMLKQ